MVTETEAYDITVQYLLWEESIDTQEILESGVIPQLQGFTVQPGKVSDSIYGGKGKYFCKKTQGYVPFENPPLTTKDGIPLRIMVRTQRISTHDINRGEIPFKDQILALNHHYMLDLVTQDLGSSQLIVPNLGEQSVVIAAENLRSFAFENVLRAYMAKSSTSTSLYQHYMAGKREFCGHHLPDDLVPNGPLPYVMDTPSTKSDTHDMSVSDRVLVLKMICKPYEYSRIKSQSLVAFKKIADLLRLKGLIAVDTKTEHGLNQRDEIVAQDEVWTMDSSRFWLLEDYQTQQDLLQAGKEKELVAYLEETQPGITEREYTVNDQMIIVPKSFSKEFARGFSQGEAGYSEEQRVIIAVRYILGIQHLLGREFVPDIRPHSERVVSGLQTIVRELL